MGSLLREHAIEHVDLLKLDIEGAEREVFSGSAAWIDRVDALAIELHDRLKPGCTESFMRATADFPVRWRQGENAFAARTDACVRPPAPPIVH